MIVPIFPLPNVVLFPKTVVPLHIFEGRYRAMVEAALAGDGKIAIVLLRGESQYSARPPIFDIACLGNIETYAELEGGKYNILLAGVQRVRLLQEIENSPYRLADVVPVREAKLDDQAPEVMRRRNHLDALFIRFSELMADGAGRSRQVVSQFDFETLVNTVASTLNLPPESKQVLLEANDVAARCDMLVPLVQQQVEALVIARRFEEIKPRDPNLN
jgi:Lon protease-like protein